MLGWSYLKVGCVGLLAAIFIVSTFLSVSIVTDIQGEVGSANYSTHTDLEDVILVTEDDLFKMEEAKLKAEAPTLTYSPFIGYSLYWGVMVRLGSWFTPRNFQVVKLFLLTVSVVNSLTSIYSLLAILLYSEKLCHCWCCHPTPLLLQEAGLMLAEVQIIVTLILAFTTYHGMTVQGTAGFIIIQIAIICVSSVLSKYYREEKDRMEEAFMELEPDAEYSHSTQYSPVTNQGFVEEESTLGTEYQPCPTKDDIFLHQEGATCPPENPEWTQICEMFPTMDPEIVRAVWLQKTSRQEAIETLLEMQKLD